MPRFTAEGPIRIAHLSNKKTDPVVRRLIYVGFEDVRPRRFYDSRKADNPIGRVRWYKGTWEYGHDNLTEEGLALFEGLQALPEDLAGTIWEQWLPWSWRDEFGDYMRLEIDLDVVDDLVAHIKRVLRELYGEDVKIVVDLA